MKRALHFLEQKKGLGNEALFQQSRRWVLTLLMSTLLTIGAQAVTRTWDNGGGDGLWSTAANWSGDVVPGSVDAAVFNATSTANCTIDVSPTVQSVTIDAAYTGIVGLGANTLTVSAGFAVATATAFDGGTGLLKLTGTTTVNSVASVYNLQISSGNNSQIILSQDFQVLNTLTLDAMAGFSLSGAGKKIKVNGNVSTLVTSWPNNGNLNFISLTGSTDQTISGTGSFYNLNISKTGGDVLMAADVNLAYDGQLTGTGYLKNTGGVFRLTGNVTLNFGGQMDDLRISSGNNSVVVLTQDVQVNNTLTLDAFAAVTLSGAGRKIKVNGNVSNAITFWGGATSAAISLVGNTDQTITGTGTFYFLDVSKTGGDVLMPVDVSIYGGSLTGTGLFKNTGGVFRLIGSVTLNFSGQLDDLRISSGNNSVVTLTQDVQVNNTLALSAMAGFSLSGAGKKIKVNGNVSTLVTSWPNNGNLNFISLTGSTDQTISGTGSFYNLNISKTGGDVLMAADVNLAHDGQLTGTGYLKNTGGVFRILNNATLNFSGQIDDLRIAPGGFSTNVIILIQDVQVLNTLTLDAIASLTFSGNTKKIKVNGNVSTQATNWGNLSAAISLTGNTDQTISGTGLLYWLDVSKTGGNVLLANIIPLMSKLTGSGWIKNAGGVLQLYGNPTVDFSGQVDDVRITGSSNIPLTQDLQVLNTLTLDALNNFSLSGSNKKIKVNGNVSTAVVSWANNGNLNFISLTGSTDQTISGTGSLYNLNISKTGGDVLMAADVNLAYDGQLTGTGYLKNTGGVFRLTGNVTLNFGGQMDDLRISSGNNSVVVLTQDVQVNNTLTLDAFAAFNLSGAGKKIKVNGNVSTAITFWSGATSATISLSGSTDQTITGAGNFYRLDIAKTGGDVLMAADVNLYYGGVLTGTGLFKNTGGVFRLIGNATLNFSGQLDDLRISSGINSVVTLTQDLNVNNTLVLDAFPYLTLSGAGRKIKVKGNVSTGITDWTGSTNAAISLVGSTNQTISGAGNFYLLDIAKTGGDVLMPVDVNLYTGGVLTGAGLFKNTGGVFRLLGNATLNFSGQMDDLRISSGINSVVTLTQDLNVNNTLVLDAFPYFNLSGTGRKLKVSGNVSTGIIYWSGATNAAAAISLVGSTNQTITGAGNFYLLDIAKTGGDVLMPVDVNLYFGGVLTGTGLFKNTGGVFRLLGNATLNFSGQMDDLRISSGINSVVTLTQDLLVNNTLVLDVFDYLTLSGAGRKIKVNGNVSTGITYWNGATNAAISLVGSTNQTIDGTGTLSLLDVSKSSGLVLMNTALIRSSYTTVTVSSGAWDLNSYTVTSFGGFTTTGGKITGTGTLAGAVACNAGGGGIAPGNSPACITINGNLVMNSGSTLTTEIGGTTPCTQFDQLIVNGTVTLNNPTLATTGSTVVLPSAISIIDNNLTDAVTGTFNGQANNSSITLGGNVYRVSYNGGTGNDVTLTSFQEINVLGNSVTIADGDNTPSVTDDTDYGNVNVGNNSAKTYTIQNLGTLPLSVSAITMTGVNASEFVVSGISLPTSISAGGSITFVVTFTPIAIGTRTATINIANDDIDEATYDFAVKGEATCSTPAFTACPANQTVSTTSGFCTSVVTYNAMASGAPAPTYTYILSGTTTGSGSGTGSGATYNKGVTTVTITATNSCGAPNCTFTVTVNDTQAPSLTCPANVTVNNDANLCLAAVTVPDVPVTNDNCGFQPGNALDFDGTNDNVSLPTSISVSQLNQFTVETWVKRDIAKYGVIYNETDPLSDVYSGLLNIYLGADGRLGVILRDKDGLGLLGSGTINIPTGLWAHIAVVRTSTTNIKVYINGTLIQDLNFTEPAPFPISWINAGATQRMGFDSYSFLDGKLDELRIWNTARTQAQIEANMGNEISAQAGLVAYYPFNQGIANGNNTGISVVNDGSGGSFNGILNNFALTGASSNWSDGTVLGIGVSLLNNFNNGLFASSTYPVGTTNVVWTAKDASNNTGTCTQTITVVDNQKPNLTCPTTQSIVLNNNCEATLGSYTGLATTSDNCTATANIALTQTPVSGTVGSGLGPINVVITAQDAAGNQQTCNFTVNKLDQQAPTITCPTDQIVILGNDCTVATPSYTQNATTNDNCSAPTVTQATSGFGDNALNFDGTNDYVNIPNAAELSFATGNYTLEAWIKKTGNASAGVVSKYTLPGNQGARGYQLLAASKAQFQSKSNAASVVTLTSTTNVDDNQWHHIAGVRNGLQLLLYVDGNLEATATVPASHTTDNALAVQLGRFINNTGYYTGSMDEVRIWNLARTQAQIQANRNIQLTGTEPGLVTYYNFNQGVANGNNSAVTTLTDAPATLGGSNNGALNGFALTSTSSNWVAGVQGGSVFTGIQSQTVTLVATDISGNSATCSFTVTSQDQIPPTIACPANLSAFATSAAGATVNYTAPVGTDNCSGNGTAQTAGLAGGATFPIGTTTNTFTVTAANGQTANCSFTVTVSGLAPDLVCPADLTVDTDQGVCTAVVSYAATETAGIPASTITYDINPGSVFAVGAIVVTATATNAVGADQCSFTVTVEDTEAPGAICQNLTVQLDASGNAIVTAASVNNGSSDACGIGALSLSSMNFNCANLGTNTVTLLVSDNNGNAATCTATVTVQDNLPPSIVCPANHSLTLGVDCEAIAPNFLGLATATDNCSATTAQDLTAGSTLTGTGAQTVTLTATDQSGNTATCSFTLTRVDQIAPSIHCPAQIEQNTDAGQCSASVPFASAVTASDYCDASLNLSFSPGSGSVFNVGNTTVTATATDDAGNTASCNFVVIVKDAELPTISCATNVTLNAMAGICTATATLANPTVNDNCQIAGNGLDFDGANDYIEAGTGMATLNNFTMESWIYYRGGAQWILNFTNGSGERVGLEVNAGKIWTYNNAPGFPTASFGGGTINTNQWYHVAYTNNSLSGKKLYINGVEVASNASTIAPVNLTAPVHFNIGRIYNSPFFFNGKMDEVRVWSVTRTQAEIQANMNSQLSAQPGLEAAYHFDQGIPGGNNGAVTTAIDASGNGYTGTLNGFTLNGPTSNFVSGMLGGQTSNAPANYTVGNTTVTWTVSDVNGNTASCNQTVTVTDNQNPVITCPANIASNTDPNLCTAVVNFTATATDNCNASPAFGYSPASGAVFALGETIVTATANDGNGNTAACTFSITVSDHQVPSALCHDVSIQLGALGNAGLTAAQVNNGSSDACGISAMTVSPKAYSCAMVGENIVTLTVTDNNGNTNTCQATVSVTDPIAPVAQCHDLTVSLDGSGNATVTADQVDDGTSDVCGIASLVLSPMAFTCANLGVNTVVLTATDNSGNTGSCTATVTIEDNSAPSIVCPANQTIPMGANCEAVMANYAGMVNADDNCSLTLTQSPAAGSTLSGIGSITVTFTATDQGSLTANCSFTLTKADHIAPSITCPSLPVLQDNDGGQCNAVVQFASAATASDYCDASLNLTYSPASGTAFKVGNTTVTATATDDSGNTATCNFVVTVKDAEAPVVNCPAVSIEQNADLGACNTTVTFSVTASDNCDNDLSITLSQASGTVFPVGTTNVFYSATDDANNSASCSFVVIISDTQAPTVVCPANRTSSTDPNLCSAVHNFTATASDNCNASPSITFSPVSGSAFGLGETTVTATAGDGNGNTSTCSFTITVSDTQKPTLSCPTGITQAAATGICSAIVNFSVSASDNCNPNPALSGSHNSGASFNVGTTTVKYTANDGNGNTAACSFSVIVTDNQLPTITCPANIVQNNDANQCSAVVNYTVTASDNCPSALAIAYSKASGTVFQLGATTVTATANDGNGNTASCTFTVTINDTQLPSIACPANITVNNTANLCSAVVTVPAPTATDNCSTGLGNALDFDGVNDFILIGNINAISNGVAGRYTVEMWVNMDAYNPGYTYVYGDEQSANRGILFEVSPTGFVTTFHPNTGRVSSSNIKVPLGTWTHIALVQDGSTVKSYVNGVFDATLLSGANMHIETSAGTNLGQFPLSGRLLDGRMDEVRVWNYDRTQAQISAAMNGELSGSESGLEAYYNFNQGIAGANNGGINTLPDLAATGGTNTGSLSGFALNGSSSNWVNGVASGSTVLSNNFNNTSNASGTYPVGTTNITWTATDASGNTVTCAQTVTVLDNQQPNLTCPATQSIVLNASCEAILGSYTGLAAKSDNCTATANIVLTQTPVSGTAISGFGPMNVVITAQDAAGNQRTCNFTVNKLDTQVPTITCPADQIVALGNDCTVAMPNYAQAATTTDNCGAPTVTQSGLALGNALDLDGVNDYVSVPSSTNLVSYGTSDEVTIEYWANPSNTISNIFEPITAKRFSSNAAGWVMDKVNATGGHEHWLRFASGWVVINATYTVNTWNHVAVTYKDGQGMKVYVNGVLAGSNAVNSNLLTDNAPLEIGGETGFSAFKYKGKVDEFRVWNVARTQAQIQATMNAELNGSESGLIQYLRFNQGVAGGNNAGLTNATATTGNAGTLLNFALNGATSNWVAGAQSLTSNTFTGIQTKTVTLTATDVAGNTATCSFTVTSQDQTAPSINCPANQTLVLNASCNATMGNYASLTGVADNCATTLVQSPASGAALSGVGSQSVTMTATDISGNTASCSFNVSRVDNTNPVITHCPVNRPIYLNADCQVVIPDFTAELTATDNCSAITTSQSSAGLVLSLTHGSTTTAVINVSDASHNTVSCSVILTGQDNSLPTLACPANQNIELVANCQATLPDYTVMATAADNCTSAANIALAQSPAIGSTVSVAGNQVITLKATDQAGNTKTCQFNVSKVDHTAPTAVCNNITVELVDRNTYTLSASEIDAIALGSGDNCAFSYAISAGLTQYDCDNRNTKPLVTLTVTDASGNTATCTAKVLILDPNSVCNEPPVAVCQDITVNLDADCTASITNDAVNNGSSDPDGDVLSYLVSQNSFSGVGTTTVTLTVSDGEFTNACTATVTTLDVTAPVADITSLEEVVVECSVTLDPPTATDACDGAITATTSNPTTYTAQGTYTVTWTYTDTHGNTSIQTQTVIVDDNTPLSIKCPTAQTQVLGSNNCQTALNNYIAMAISSDNCGTVTVTQSPAIGSAYNGTQTVAVTLTGTDVGGNSASCSFDVVLQDNTSPAAVCQDVTVQLDASGNGSLTAAQVNNGSNDACGIASTILSRTSFSCADGEGIGNTGGAEVQAITGQDNTGSQSWLGTLGSRFDVPSGPGIWISKLGAFDDGQNGITGIQTGGSIRVAIFNRNTQTIVPGLDVYISGSGDPLADKFRMRSISPVYLTPGQYMLVSQGFHSGEKNGNTNYGNNPSIKVSVPGYLSFSTEDYGSNVSGTFSYPTNPGAGVNGPNYWHSASFNFTQATISNIVTLTVTDVNGNTSTCSSTVSVQDNVAPVATCQNVTVQLNAAGTASTTAAAVNNGSSDACGIKTVALNNSNFTCANLGVNTVTLTATDNSNNTATCTATITVQDLIAPTAKCKNAVVALGPTGLATLTPALVNNASTDNCTVQNLALSQTLFHCNEVGISMVTLTVTDNSSNTASCTATVTVEDNLNPVIVCPSGIQTVALGANCSLPMPDFAPTLLNVTDNCSFVLTQSPAPGTPVNGAQGMQFVHMAATDPGGLSAVCDILIDVKDNTPPTALCQNLNVALDIDGNASITAAMVNNGSADGCGISSKTISKTSFNCSNVGANTVTLTVKDVNNNTSTCTATITVSDPIPPAANCNNVVVHLNSAGQASITVANVNDNSYDACGIASTTISQSAFDCSQVGVNTVTLTVTDVNGNVNTCSAEISVLDVIKPTTLCKNATVVLDANGEASILESDVDNASFDNCGIFSLNASPNTFTCANTGNNTVVLTATDVNGNVATCSTVVSVQDNTYPVALCQNVTVELNASGAGILSAAQVDAGSSDICGLQSLVLSQTSYDCSQVGPHTVVLTATDNSNHASTCSAVISVVDHIAPVAACKDITLPLNAMGNATITVADVNNNSTDACGIQSATISTSSFNCSKVGLNNVTLTVTDLNSNISTCISNVTVVDQLPPTALCKNLTLSLNAAGAASASAAQINNGSTDNCSIQSMVLSQTAFNCVHLGNNTVVLTVTDVNNNVSTCNASITVKDLIKPVALCRNLNLSLNLSGQTSITTADVNNGSSDNCGFTLSLSNSSFNCSNVGLNTVTLTNTDAAGNTATCQASITVKDQVAPNPGCQNYTVALNAQGDGCATAANVAANAYDACGIASIFYLQTATNENKVENGTFNYSSSYWQSQYIDWNGGWKASGGNPGGYYALNGTGSCTSDPTLKQTVDGLNAGKTYIISGDYRGSGTSTAASFGIFADNQLISQLPNPGAVWTHFSVTFTASDDNQQISFKGEMGCDGTDYGIDNLSVVKSNTLSTMCFDCSHEDHGCGDDLHGGGGTAAKITEGAEHDDNNDDDETLGLGNHLVTIVVTDNNGNTASCSATISVVDNLAPVADCRNVTVNLNSNGQANISANSVEDDSYDNCGIDHISVNKTSFNCSNVGANTVVLSVTDDSGNTGTCTASVTVKDVHKPQISCLQNKTLTLNSNCQVIMPDYTANASVWDNCTVVITQTPAPGTLISGSSAILVTLKATDPSGNNSSSDFYLYLKDLTPPTALCKNATLVLGSNGQVSIAAADVNNGSSDGCGLQSLSLSATSFNCSKVGPNNVTLTVTDMGGNVSSCNAVVTIVDNVKPIAICKNVTATLNSSGTVSISTAQVNNGSSDNCSIQSMSLSQTAFSCNTLGSNTVTLTVTDAYQNTASCNATITIQDNIKPVALCRNLTLPLNAAGSGTISVADLNNGSSDNCGFTLGLSKTSFNCANVGSNLVTLTATDLSGNTATCSATVTVKDVTSPVALCKNATVALGANGEVAITTATINNGSTDVCGIQSLALSTTGFNCSKVGTNNVTLSVTDIGGNVSTCVGVVTVVDNLKPVALCKNVTLALNASGTASLATTQVNNGSSDNCSIQSMGLSQTAYSCAQVGSNTVTLTVTDVNQNTATCNATVTVQDNTKPVALCRNMTLQLSAAGSAAITVADINNGSSDNCGFTLGLNKTSFNCGNLGSNTVTLTATDASGNTGTCQASVTVKDLTAPVALCKNITAVLGSNGQVVVTPQMVNNGSSDACGISEMTVPSNCNNVFDCGDTGASFPVTLQVKDASGNTSSCVSNVAISAGTIDSDCDGVPDPCDLCPGGDDHVDNNHDGKPDCAFVPSYSSIITDWKCGNNKVYICHKTGSNGNPTNTLCVAYSAVSAHIGHGDYIGYCGNSDCLLGGPTGGKPEGNNDGHDQTTGRDEQEQDDLGENIQNMLLFPNPTSGDVFIGLDGFVGKSVTLRLFDQMGKQLWVLDLPDAQDEMIQLRLQEMGLASGLYRVVLQSESRTITKQLAFSSKE